MNNINAYEEESSELSLDKFIVQYQPLVKKIALYLKRRLPSHIDLDDLLQSGVIGLLEARNGFQENQGASFETYAGIRIRGAMVDALRKNSWISRDAIKNMKKISKAINRVEQRNQAPASSDDIAKELGVTLDEYYQLSQDAIAFNILNLDELEQAGIALEDTEKSPQEDTEAELAKIKLKAVLIDLPEREQLLLSLYYIEEFTFKQIGEILEVSEARVCQLHTQAVARIKSKMMKDSTEMEEEDDYITSSK